MIATIPKRWVGVHPRSHARGKTPSGLPWGSVAGKQRRPTQNDRAEVVRSVLADLSSGQEFDTIIERLAVVHPKNNTFPAEELLELAADAIEESGATSSHPIAYERIRENYLLERVFRGKVEHHRSHYTLSAAAMIRGGVYPDLLGEVGWWHNDDLWFYAFFALVIYMRISAERSERSFEQVAQALAARRGVALDQ
jgi:hypothetical protein